MDLTEASTKEQYHELLFGNHMPRVIFNNKIQPNFLSMVGITVKCSGVFMILMSEDQIVFCYKSLFGILVFIFLLQY
jgi:hypothetical protein